MGPKPTPSKPTVGTLQNELNHLRTKFNDLEKENKELKSLNTSLEGRVEQLESYQCTSKQVTEKLRNHIDSLDQYGHRSNLIIKHVPVNEVDDQQALKDTIKQYIDQDLAMGNASKDIDKLHRIGKPKVFNGVRQQNVIVRFRSHATRYRVYNERKKSKKFKIAPNLTKRREDTLFEAKKLVEKSMLSNLRTATFMGT